MIWIGIGAIVVVVVVLVLIAWSGLEKFFSESENEENDETNKPE